jgi:hypothetical protein
MEDRYLAGLYALPIGFLIGLRDGYRRWKSPNKEEFDKKNISSIGDFPIATGVFAGLDIAIYSQPFFQSVGEGAVGAGMYCISMAIGKACGYKLGLRIDAHKRENLEETCKKTEEKRFQEPDQPPRTIKL